MGYRNMLAETQEQLSVKRNQFNNCIDPELMEILIKEVSVLEEKQNLCIKRIKELQMV